MLGEHSPKEAHPKEAFPLTSLLVEPNANCGNEHVNFVGPDLCPTTSSAPTIYAHGNSETYPRDKMCSLASF